MSCCFLLRWLGDGCFGGQFGVKKTLAECLVIRGDASLHEFFGNVLNMICAGRIRRGEIEGVSGVCMDMNRTLLVHVVSESKDKKGNVRGPSDVRVVVDVMRNEKGGLKCASDITESSGFGLGIWIEPLLYLIK